MMLLSTLENTLNRNIAASSAARALCVRLDGKSVRVQVLGLPLDMKLQVESERVSLTRATDAQADATLSGSLLGLMNLAGAQPESAVRGGSVRIEGDAEVAQAFRDLLKHARPELEEELSRHIGDVAAHQLGNVWRGLTRFGRRAADTFALNVGEYLQEESRDLPSRTELDEFIHGVDALRDDVARAEARLTQLEQKKQRT